MLTATFLIVGLFASSMVFTSCNSTKTEQQEEVKDNHDHEHMESENHDASSELAYACPMHPEITGKEGETCSKCGMKLELVNNADTTKAHTEHQH